MVIDVVLQVSSVYNWAYETNIRGKLPEYVLSQHFIIENGCNTKDFKTIFTVGFPNKFVGNSHLDSALTTLFFNKANYLTDLRIHVYDSSDVIKFYYIIYTNRIRVLEDVSMKYYF